jgi:hypothetical protein
LWYAGDFDPRNSLPGALENTNNTWGTPFEAQVWVPFIPASDTNALHKHVLITAVIFNEFTNTPDSNPPADFAGMTYAFRTGVLAGHGGTLGPHGTCPSASAVYTGDHDPAFGAQSYEFSYTCNLSLTPIKVPVGTITWVNILPTFTVSSDAALSNAIDLPPGDRLGWSNDFYNTFYVHSPGFNFKPATSVFKGYEQFAVAIAGTYVD